MYSDNTKIIYYIITVLVGLIIGVMIGLYFFKKDINRGPNSNKIKEMIYEEKDGKKYKWIPKITICPISHSMFLLKNKDFIDDHY